MIYYTETNVITIVVGIIMMIQGRITSSKNETSHLVMQVMLTMLIIFSVGDIFAYYFRGKNYIGVEISNILYFISMAIGCYFWFLFILLKMEKVTHLKKTIVCTCMPALLLCLAILTNPLTNYFFSVDSELLYHRGPGVLLTWGVEWGYILIALVVNIFVLVTDKRSYKKKEYKGYLYFLIPLALAAVCQMKFYGTTTTQVGYMIALLMAFLNNQHFQAMTDDLTGVKNKNAFLKYRDSIVNTAKPINLTLFMIDADKFKSINDTLGHIKGDQALKDIADILKNSIESMKDEKILLFRYAGDEFVIIADNIKSSNIPVLLNRIEDNIKIKNSYNADRGEKYSIMLSVGYEQKECMEMEDFDQLLILADDAMYNKKNSKVRAGRIKD